MKALNPTLGNGYKLTPKIFKAKLKYATYEMPFQSTQSHAAAFQIRYIIVCLRAGSLVGRSTSNYLCITVTKDGLSTRRPNSTPHKAVNAEVQLRTEQNATLRFLTLRNPRIKISNVNSLRNLGQDSKAPSTPLSLMAPGRQNWGDHGTVAARPYRPAKQHNLAS